MVEFLTLLQTISTPKSNAVYHNTIRIRLPIWEVMSKKYLQMNTTVSARNWYSKGAVRKWQ